MKKILFFILLISSVLCYSQSDYSLAENYYRQADYKKAIQYYQKLIERNPFNSFYLKRLITCYQETDQFDVAKQTILDALKINPSQSFWYVELGFNYQKQNQDSLAQKEYSKAIELISQNPSVGSTTGRFFRENNLLEEAIKAYKLAMSLNENLNFDFQLARIYGELGEFDKMFESYIDLIDKNDAYIGSVKRYASTYITDDSSNKYNLSFKRALLKRSVSNPKPEWNQLLSWLFTMQGDFYKAYIQEKAVFIRNATSIDNLSVLGKIAFDNKALEDAKEIFSYVLDNASSVETKIETEVYLLRIEVLTNSKNVLSLFEQKLVKYGYSNQTLSIQKEYANYLTFNLNQPNKATQVLEKALSLAVSRFEKARIKLKLAEVLVFTGKFNKALIYFSQVQTQLKNHPLSQEARYKVAETSFFKGDFTWAKTQLKVLKSSSSQLIANDAVDLFLIITDNEPKDSLPTGLKEYAKAKLLSYQNKNDQAITTLSKVIKNYQGRNIEDEALLAIADLYIKSNQFDLAINSLEKIISIDATGVFVDDAYFLLAEIYRKHLKNNEKASEYYQKIIFEQASSIYLVDARKKFRQLRGDNIK